MYTGIFNIQVIINALGKRLIDKSQLQSAPVTSCWESRLRETFLSGRLHTGHSSLQTVMAHGCYLSAEELQVFKERGAAIAHCPSSNLS